MPTLTRLGAAVVGLGMLLACTPDGPRVTDGGRGTVVHVVDGDTVIVDLGGAEESVRLLGIDTPEVARPDQTEECFGPEASARTRVLLPVGTDVRLERDREARDRFGRLLAYVYRAEDDLFVNEALVAEGSADTLSIEPNTAYRRELSAARAAARASRSRSRRTSVPT
ncbi:MAG: thermonuclease family protein, partial [Actinomycetota bacterium]